MSVMQGADIAGDARYPLVYRVTFASRIAAVTLCVIFGVGGSMLLGFTVLQWSENIVANLFLGFLAATLTLGSIGGLVYAFRARITIGRDAIELRRLFRTIRLNRCDILGRRYNVGRGGTKYPVLVLRHGASLVLQPDDFGLDGWFDAWFLALPDLDAADRTAALDAVAKDASLGATVRERLDRLAAARRLSKILNLLALAMGAWALVFPRPYQWAVAALALLPWVAAGMLWSRPNLYQVDFRPGDVKAPLFGLILAPVAVLGMRALLDVTLIDLKALCVWGMVAGLATFLALVAAPHGETGPSSQRKALALILLPFFLAYGISLVALVDTAWDEASPVLYKATITGKYVHRGKSRSYYLELSPWNPGIDENEIRVPGHYYYSVEKGDAICVRLHPGVFGLRWVGVGGCVRGSAS